MPALLLPLALAALLTLAIPLAIHLARRSEALPVDFAALEWLRPTPRPRSRLRFDEWPLLAARLLLLALLAVALARPVLPGSADRTPVVAAVPGIDAGPPPANARTLWLTPGFPPGDTPIDCPAPLPPAGEARGGVAALGEGTSAGSPAAVVPLPSPLPPAGEARGGAAAPGEGVSARPACTPQASLSTLIRQLDAELPTGVPLTLIVPETLTGMDAERPRLTRPVTWRIVPGAMPDATPAARPAPPRFSLRQPPGPDRGLRYLRAATAALATPTTVDAPDAPLPATATTLVWLAPGPLPAAVRDWIAAGHTALVAHDTIIQPADTTTPWRDSLGAPVVTARPLGAGRLLRFAAPLTPSALPALVEPDFPSRLAALLTPPAPAPTRVAAANLRPVTGAAPYPQPARDLLPWLALAIAAVFLAERWLATRAARGPTP